MFILAQPTFTVHELQDLDYQILEELISLRKEVAEANKKIERLESKDSAGDTYIRWGRKSCPDNETSLVYTGFMAGSDKSHSGAGSNYLCLTDTPIWDQYRDGKVNSYGRITGAEYQFWNQRSTGAAEFFGDNMYNHNAPCAVCYTKRRVSVMVPGRNICSKGWTMEYSGYLVTGYHGDKSATEYVCLDRRPEKVINGDADDEDNRLYLVEATCSGSLACPPYVAGREITCVVCSL